MRLYLTGKRGGTKAFKITTARAVTDIDDIIEERLSYESSHPSSFSYFSIKESICIGINNIWCIYTTEVNSTTTAKRLTKKDFMVLLEDYIRRHPLRYKKVKSIMTEARSQED